MKRVALLVGTRPECIKMAPIYLELKQSSKIQPIFLSTAQHRQMLDQTLAVFGITPDGDLDVMQTGQTLSSLTCRALKSVADWITREDIDAVLVQGDTT